ncbi:MAG: RnfH family protein [Burkholderiales bacterium]
MARLRVELVDARPGGARRVPLELEDGAKVRDALAAAGWDLPRAAGIHGQRVALDTRLGDGDRVEVYRPLRVDPKQARRQRALRQVTRTSPSPPGARSPSRARGRRRR